LSEAPTKDVDRLESLKELNGKSYVIVGCGSNELKKGRGDWIDSHDFVVRFNNYILKGYEKDYGSKTDIFVSNFDKRCRKNNEAKVKEIKNIVCAFPINDWKYIWTGNRDIELIEKHVTLMAPTGYINELKKLYNNPSTGLAFLWWLYKEIGVLPKDKLLGFTHFSGDALPFHYYSKKEDDIRTQIVSRTHAHTHQPEGEKKIFDIVIGENNG